MTLERNARFDTGLKFFKDSGSKVDFFIKGRTIAVLNFCGKIPFDSDVLTMSVIAAVVCCKILDKSLVGMGSNKHDDFDDLLMTDMISSHVHCLNESI